MRKVYRLGSLFGGLLALAACMPEPPLRDGGDPAFVRQVVPQLLGRQPRNGEERRFFNDVLSASVTPVDGRRGLLRGLMQSPEFAERWSEFLLRQTDVDRIEQPLASCFGTPNGPPSSSLNALLASSSSTSVAGSSEFNGADVLASLFAQRDSDLSPLLRLSLFTTHAGRRGTDDQETVASRVQQTFLDRQTDCMGCHNSAYATTSRGSGWQRHYPMLGHFEKSLYGAHDGPERVSAVAEAFRVSASMAPTECAGACTDGEQPWSRLQRTCGDFVARGSIPPARSEIRFGTLTATNAQIWNVEEMLRTGVEAMRGSYLRRSIGPGDQLCTSCPAGRLQTIVKDVCMSCHNPERAPSLGVFSFQLGSSPDELKMVGAGWNDLVRDQIDFIDDVVQSEYMPPASTRITSADRDSIKSATAALKAEVDGGRSCSCGSGSVGRQVAPADAFAFLTAANVVNGVWKELFGRPLTTPNHFPRTAAQAGTLEFVAQRFVHDGWSLRALLERLYLGKYFSRLAPEGLASGLDVVAHFEVPPVLDPWTQADRRVTPSPDALGRNNAMSEGIRRRPVRTLLKAASAALGWPAPQNFPGDSAPSRATHIALGDDLSSESAGSVDADLQNMLAWERYAGTCENPTGEQDWMDLLVARAVAAGATREQAVWVLKDRLIGEPWIEDAAERTVLQAALGALTAPVSAGDEAKLRGVCGALLHSPQFMLQGLTTEGARSPSSLPFAACLPGEACTYKQICDSWSPLFERAGYTLTCPTSDLSRLTIRPRLVLRVEQLPSLCTNGVCGWLPQALDSSCQQSPGACLPTGALSCDTRCSGMSCCGVGVEDLDRAFSRGEQGVLYTLAHGSTVEQAEKVLLVSAGGQTRELKVGTLLEAGQILRFQRGSRFAAQGPYGKIATPSQGLDFEIKRDSVEVRIGRIAKPEVDAEEYWGSALPSQGHQLEVLAKLRRGTKSADVKMSPTSNPGQPRVFFDPQTSRYRSLRYGAAN